MGTVATNLLPIRVQTKARTEALVTGIGMARLSAHGLEAHGTFCGTATSRDREGPPQLIVPNEGAKTRHSTPTTHTNVENWYVGANSYSIHAL